MKCLGKAMVVLLVLVGYVISAQVPQRIAYQAVLRNSDGTVMANQQVELQVLLHRTTATGDVLYSETHTKTTTNQRHVRRPDADHPPIHAALRPHRPASGA